eukprot:776627-Prymnesium_polylepis.1
MRLFTSSSNKGSSATHKEQTKTRTSTSVVYRIGSEPTLLTRLRERIAALGRVGTYQLQATNITCYEKGQFFRAHSDAPRAQKRPWVDRLLEGKETAKQLSGLNELCFLPDRFITVWIYLNDVDKGGHTLFHTSNPDDELYGSVLPRLGKVLGKEVPDVPRTRSKSTKNLRVKPKAGMAVIHFPTPTKEYMGMVDDLAIHEGEEAVDPDPKYILQQFIYSDPLEPALEMLEAAFRSSTTPNPTGLGFEERVENNLTSVRRCSE